VSNPLRFWPPPEKLWHSEGCSEQLTACYFVAGRRECQIHYYSEYIQRCAPTYGAYMICPWKQKRTLWSGCSPSSPSLLTYT